MSFGAVRTPLRMIHGLLGSSRFFDPQRLLADSDVHTPDLLGYGSKRTVERGIDLHGHSVGGAVMMLATDRVPELVRGLIGVEGTTP